MSPAFAKGSEFDLATASKGLSRVSVPRDFKSDLCFASLSGETWYDITSCLLRSGNT